MGNCGSGLGTQAIMAEELFGRWRDFILLEEEDSTIGVISKGE